MLRTEELVVKVDDEGGKKCLLDHISFEVKDGEMLVITGTASHKSYIRDIQRNIPFSLPVLCPY